MGRGQTAQDSFSQVFGERRGHSARLIADHNWRALLTSPNAEPQQIAGALFGDLSQVMRHSGVYTLQRFGVSGADSRQVVRGHGPQTLHLLPVPLGEQEHINPTALCGKMLENSKTNSIGRGAWLEAGERELKRCARCAKRAEEIAETRDVAECSPFFPDDQDEFDDKLKARCLALAEQALTEQLEPDEVEALADHAYFELLGAQAVALAEAHPARSIKALNSQERHNLPKEWGYPGPIEELLDGVDWKAIFGPFLPRDRQQWVIPTTIEWERYRQALLAQLKPLAHARLKARRLEVAEERLSTAQAELEAAESELAAAQR